MKTCIKCGSHAFNLYAEKIDQGGLCDVHYWQGRAHRAEALAQDEKGLFIDLIAQHEGLAEELAQDEQSSSQRRLAKVEPCAVCGEGKARLSVLRSCDTCHSEYAGQAEMNAALAQPKRPWGKPWVSLTDEEIEDCMEMSIQKTCRAVGAKLKEKNT